MKTEYTHQVRILLRHAMAAEPKAPLRARTDAAIVCTYQCILTYARAEQEFLEIDAPLSTPEMMFVANIIDAAEEHATQLVKISTCMMRASRGGVPLCINEFNKIKLPDYLAARSGKYYFTVGETDLDIVRWRGFLEGFVVSKRIAAFNRKDLIES